MKKRFAEQTHEYSEGIGMVFSEGEGRGNGGILLGKGLGSKPMSTPKVRNDLLRRRREEETGSLRKGLGRKQEYIALLV